MASASYCADVVEIISPDLNPSYNNVIRIVAEGIQSELGNTKHHIYKDTPKNVSDNSIILTNKALRAIDKLSTPLTKKHILGLIEITTEDKVYGVSMFIDPSSYIAEVLLLNSKIENVVFFNDIRRNVSQSKIYLQNKFGINVRSVSAGTVGDAINIFHQENAIANGKTAFIFTRGFVELAEDILLEMIIKETWRTGVMTVSSKPQYIKKGMVLGLAADYYSYGVQIGLLHKNAREQDYNNPYVELLQRYIRAINIRTAKHIEINLSTRILNRYKLSYSGN